MTRFNWEFFANLSGALRPTGSQVSGEGGFDSRPTLWVFAPDNPHGWQWEGAIERVVFHYSSVPEPLREACVARGGALSARLTEADVAALRELAASLTGHYRAPTPVSLLHFDRALIDLSLILLRDESAAGAEQPLETAPLERVERAVEWYLLNLEERPTLDELAARAHVSTAHLRRQFTRIYGRGPHQVLTELRLEKAARLLATTSETLDTVARRSGFGGASALSRVFKDKYKVYPGEWRVALAGRELPPQRFSRLLERVAGEVFDAGLGI